MATATQRRLIESPRAELRLGLAAAWIHALPVSDEILVIGASNDAATELIRGIAHQRGSAFGLHRFTLGRLATELAKHALAERGLAPIGRLPFEALCARVVDRLRTRGGLVRLGPVIDQPGLPRALARTLAELRLAGGTAVAGDADLTAALEILDEELAAHHLADRALVVALATEVARDGAAASTLLGQHLVFVDVPLRTRREHDFVMALCARAPSVFASVVTGDEQSRERMAATLSVDSVRHEQPPADSLTRVQHALFTGTREPASLDGSVVVLSAPGENRECVELVRRVLQEAQAGTAFDRMAVLLRAPEQYRMHLEEAFSRARIPVHFAQGTRLPDPSGRAFLALLACAAEGLSARGFAEYLSLGEIPDATTESAPPHAAAPSERWVPPDEELVPRALAAPDEPAPEDDAVIAVDGAVASGSLRTPWRWERLLVDAAVIGGRERWERRLDGLAAKLARDPEDTGDDEPTQARRARQRDDLAHLRSFALPLLDDLGSLPHQAAWGVWLDRLTALATRALRNPTRVLGVLANLLPMAEVGPVSLAEIRGVLHAQLTDLLVKPAGPRYGHVLVTTVEAARGLTFDVVFAPGLAEKMFPQKLVEDPLLLDAARRPLALGLAVEHDRVAEERLALRIAVGAAVRRVVLSYPRIDLEKGRPRVPSFYCLEVLHAAEGILPSFEELGRRADITGAARIGWPAPARAHDAIDEAEHDLAVLDPLVHTRQAPKGAARYLLDANPHLARALRARARRWAVKAWKPNDGLVIESAAAKAALVEHLPANRSFSPTALEQLSACPYRFALRTIVRLEPREVPEPIEALGALERGSLVHEVQFELLGELRSAGELPVRSANLEATRDRLDGVLDRVAAKYHDELAPAIDRVWRDGIASIRADLREWLRQLADDLGWTPSRFELAFGLPGDDGRDPLSVDEDVKLDIGIRLRGSIDLVEEGPDGSFRATDHKTGKARVGNEALIKGGASLQPVLYALVLEKLFPGKDVAGGRLHYCTSRGDFQSVMVRLDAEARDAAKLLVDTLTAHFADGFFPAAPAKGECTYCDFRPICGPYEEARTKDKQTTRLVALTKLRETR